MGILLKKMADHVAIACRKRRNWGDISFGVNGEGGSGNELEGWRVGGVSVGVQAGWDEDGK